MAFSEINDRDAEQIGGGAGIAAILIGTDPGFFMTRRAPGLAVWPGSSGVGYRYRYVSTPRTMVRYQFPVGAMKA